MGSGHGDGAGTAKRQAVGLAMLALATFAVTYDGRIHGPLDMYHEGERLAHVDTLLAGGLPYRDVYVPHGLGEDVLKPLAARWLFGDSVAALRMVGQNNYVYRGLLPPFGAVAVVMAAAAITRSMAAAGIAAALVALGLYEVSERHVLGLLSVASLAMFMHARRHRRLIVAGLLASFAGLYSLEVGLYAIAVGVAWLPLDAWIQAKSTPSVATRPVAMRHLFTFMTGVAIGVAPFIAWAAWHGILPNVWANIAMQLFQRKELYPVSYPVVSWMNDQPFLDNLKVAGGTLLIFYVIPISYVVAMIFAIARQGERIVRSGLLLASLTGAAFWITVMGRPDLWHAAFACAGFFVFVATMTISVQRLPGRGAERCALLAMIVAPIVANLWIGQGGELARNWLGRESAFLPPYLRSDGRMMRATGIPRLGSMRIPIDQADYLEAVVGYLQSKTAPDETILDLSDQGLLYYLAERPSATRFAFVNYCGTPSLRAEMVAEVTQKKPIPSYVIRYTTDVSTPDALGAFVDQHYREEVRIGPIVLLRRMESANLGTRLEGDL